MAPPQEFNLIQSPWIPVRRKSGTVHLLTPSEITQDMESNPVVAIAWPRPDFNRATLEFLIGLLSTVHLAEDDNDWQELWLNPPAPGELEKAFDEYAYAFNLGGSNSRFMQDQDELASGKTKSISQLLIDSPGDQTLRKNADHFIKRGTVNVLCRGAAAIALFTLNTYAPSGGAGHLTSVRGGGPLTTLAHFNHPRFDRNLWTMLWPNVETQEKAANRCVKELPNDPSLIFPWLKATRTSESSTGQTTSPADVDPRQVYWGMPRRIRLDFEEAENRPCDITGQNDDLLVSSYRTLTYGTDYPSEAFSHPLSPYYQTSSKDGKRLPVHATSATFSYKDWPGILFESSVRGSMRTPALCVTTARQHFNNLDERPPNRLIQLAVFGYDMDNMKARGWTDVVQPFHTSDPTTNETLHMLIESLVGSGDFLARILTKAVKEALYENHQDVKGNWSHMEESFYQLTEPEFYSVVNDALPEIENAIEDPFERTLNLRKRWLGKLRQVCLEIFDREAPVNGSEDRSMERCARARFNLSMTLAGRNKTGRNLYETSLKIPCPNRK